MYAELHCHSNYSFQEGASSVEDLLVRSRELGYRALALTDHDNLCGAMHFAQVARALDVRAITGVEVTLADDSHLTLLAETRQGYANLCNAVSYAYITGERREPRLDSRHLSELAGGVVLLTGCRKGRVSQLLEYGRVRDAEEQLEQYLEWLGAGNVFVELQQNLVRGDTRRNKRLADIARKYGVEMVATNNVHYHAPERRRLQDALVAVKHNRSLEETHRERRPNGQFYLKSPAEMAELFRECPEAVRNTLYIAERCSFDLTRDLGYQFPDYPVPPGFTPQTYLEHLCREAAVRRYGDITLKVETRLREEFRLIRRHNLAGFFLIYYEIIQMAREIMIEVGMSDVEIPLEERPPGRGRGSSVAMLVGYLIGLSHIDPLEFNLSLDRFLSDDLGSVPDIDLDFPRNIREELIKRVHEKWGWDHAALSGMISTYKLKGAIRDLGKALGLPAQDVDKLAKRVDFLHGGDLKAEMLGLPEFRDRVDAPVWRDLIDLSGQLDGFPKYLAQHPGGMIISSSPLIDVVPVQQSAISDRYICHWDKDSIEQAGFVKIDFLALGALSQIQECLQLIEEREGECIDLSRINFEDPAVYRMIHQADTIGVFQVESAAQMQTAPRIKPVNLTDMAYEVGAVRPGVGVNDGVSLFIKRRSLGLDWDYDHPLEGRALERTMGVILFQDQVNQVAMDVAGFSALEADQLRRAFIRRNNQELIAHYWERFRQGSGELGVSEAAAERIFKKFNGHYMFPESHAFAFGVTAYHMAWLKHYYPLEFFTAIFNQQPMGFYNTETLKEDARRHGVRVLNPDINHSREKCVIRGESLLLGLRYVKGVGERAAAAIVKARDRGGTFSSIADAMERTGLQREALENLVSAGAFDQLPAAGGRGAPRDAGETGGALATRDRRGALWEVGLRYRPAGHQMALPLPVEQDMAGLPSQSSWEVMLEEYRTMGLHPGGHFMAMLRPYLGAEVLNSQEVVSLADGTEVAVSGLVIRRQRPLSKAVFITLEDEFGHIPLAVWPREYQRYRLAIREPVLVVRGEVSRRDGVMNIVVRHVIAAHEMQNLPKAKSWQ